MRASISWYRLSIAAIMIAGFMLFSAVGHAAWQVTIESKQVDTASAAGVTLKVDIVTAERLSAFSMPVVVRSTETGAFWTGSLPYDTVDMNGDHFTQGVTWGTGVSAWSAIILEMRPGPAGTVGQECNTDADTNPYNGVSPDYFAINSNGSSTLPIKATPFTFVTIAFDVLKVGGKFEFDTACASASLNTIFMVDQNIVDHGPSGTNEVVFTKGVVTVRTGPDGILSEEEGLPATYSLAQNHPNPFNANTLIDFSLREWGVVKLEVFNILGQRVATPFDGLLGAGTHSVNWDGKDASGRPVSSGMYFYRLSAGEFTQMKKMVLMK